MHPAEKLIEFARKHLGRLDRQLEIVLELGDVDAVHDFRVASRRLSEPLVVIAHWACPRRVPRLKRRLRRLRRALRRVRDLDVLHESFGSAATRPQLDAADRNRLDDLLMNARREALAIGRQKLLAGNPRKVQTDLSELLDKFRSCAASAGRAVATECETLWRRRADDLLAQQPIDDPTTDLHQCRILLKRLRYSTELRRRIADQPRGPLIDALVAMQDLLGGWNDHLFAVTQLSRFAVDATILPRCASFGAGVLLCAAARARMADTARCEALARWPQLCSTIHAEFADIGKPALA